jgi:hypothetical protein
MADDEQTCGGCQHWTPNTERTDFRNAVGFYGGPDSYVESSKKAEVVDKLFGVCTEIDIKTDLPLDAEIPLATTRDASEYFAALYTQAEFGCVLWKAKA